MERVFYYKFDKYRIMYNREYFEFDFDIIKEEIDFLYDYFELDRKVKKKLVFFENIENNDFDYIDLNEEIIVLLLSVVIDMINNINNLLDYDVFIRDCCNIGDDKYVIKKELFGWYKLWVKYNDNDVKEKIRFYFEYNYKFNKKYF